MKKYPADSGSEAAEQRWNEWNLWDRYYQSQNIMIPIKQDKKGQVFGFFALDNHELPEGGQKNLNDITDTPFKAELAGLTVYFGPIMPALQENYIKALIMLADSIDQCDQSAHSQQTALWAQRMAEWMGLSEEKIQEIMLAGRLHDIGKAVVSREILTKPGPLSETEWETMRRHPGYGAALMEPAKTLDKIRPLVRSHHERYIGGGYPDGLSGQNIPLGARILAVADAFSTMTTGRAYRSPILTETALAELVRCRGTQFDPELVDLMVAIVLGE